jgi:predicted AAA+ superfamily ATPase
MYIHRKIETQLLQLMKHFPAVAVLGSRQVGKTTLVKEISSSLEKESVYLDLENPADSAVLNHPIEFINAIGDKTIIIDEIQRNPELFPVLRSAIDLNRVNGRFILLGSASKDLLTMSSETLAGRIVYTELTPFFYSEISKLTDFRTHWLRGGYPSVFIQEDDSIRNIWMKSFLSAYVERDLRILGLGSSPVEVQRLLYMLASNHGNLLNTSSISNSLGLNAMTVRNILSFFEKSFIIRLLQPWFANLGKRLVKSTKVYFRDPGIINYLLGLKVYEDMLRHPMLGNLWEGYVIENIINTLGDEYQFYFYRTADGAECDLLIFKGMKCIAAIDAKFTPSPKRTKSITTVIQDLNPEKAFFIIPECVAPYSLNDNLFVATLEQFLLQFDL